MIKKHAQLGPQGHRSWDRCTCSRWWSTGSTR